MTATGFLVIFLCSLACSTVTWFLAFDSGKKFGKDLAEIAFIREKGELQIKAMGRVVHARRAHLLDLGNIISLLKRGVPAVSDYAGKAALAVTSDPETDQRLPEDIR